MKRKEKYNNMEATKHQCKDRKKNYNCYHINGHTKYKYPELNIKNHKKDAKKKKFLSIDSTNLVERGSGVDENILHTSMEKEVR
jgi:hypothetical protein